MVRLTEMLPRNRSLAEELLIQAASSGSPQTLLQSLITSLRSELKGDPPYAYDPQNPVVGRFVAAIYAALQIAARNGHAHTVKDLLVHASYVKFKETDAWEVILASHWPLSGVEMTSSPLHIAVKKGHLHVVREILPFFHSLSDHAIRQVIYIRSGQKWFQGQLVEWAVRWGHAPTVQLLLNTPPMQLVHDIHQLASLPDLYNLAVHYNHLDVLQLLLQSPLMSSGQFSTNVAPSADGLTALHLAAQSGSSSALQLLLKNEVYANIDINARSHPELFTPLHMAANSGNVEVVSFLLQSSLQPDLHATAMHCSKRLVDLMARDCMGRTALHYAVREGHEDVVEQLLDCSDRMQAGDIASIADHDGLLPLHIAARAGHVGLIRKLRWYAGGVDSKAEHSLNMRRRVEEVYMINKRKTISYSYGEEGAFPRPRLADSFFWSTEGFTPLHFAARYGQEAAVRELLQAVHTSVDVHGMDHSALLEFVAKDGPKEARFCRSSIDAEEKAMEELRHAWEKGMTRPPLTMQIVQWLLDQDRLEIRRRQWLLCAVEEKDMNWLKRLLVVFAELEAINADPENSEAELNYEAVIQALGVAAVSQNDANMSRELLLHPPGIRPNDAIKILCQAVAHRSFAAAREILLQVPEVVLLDNRVARSVESLMHHHIVHITIFRSEEQWEELEDFLMAVVTRERMVGASNLLRRMLPWAQQKKNNIGRHPKQRERLERLVEAILDRPELKKGLYEDRQVYLDCANAILVGAALIAGVAFQGWLQPPLGYSFGYEGEEYAEVRSPMVRLFWRFNNGAFFLAVGALIAGAKGAVPVARDTDIAGSVEKVKRAVAVASTLLGMALVCVVVAFSAAGFAVLPLESEWHMLMRNSVAWGASVCALALLWFYASVLPLLSSLPSYFVRFARRLLGMLLFIPWRLLGRLVDTYRIERLVDNLFLMDDAEIWFRMMFDAVRSFFPRQRRKLLGVEAANHTALQLHDYVESVDGDVWGITE